MQLNCGGLIKVRKQKNEGIQQDHGTGRDGTGRESFPPTIFTTGRERDLKKLTGREISSNGTGSRPGYHGKSNWKSRRKQVLFPYVFP